MMRTTCTVFREYDVVATKDLDQVYLTFPVAAAVRAQAAVRNLKALGYDVRTTTRASVKAVQAP
jgi:hypothetical protein